MNEILEKPGGVRLVVQLVFVLLFASGLYWFLMERQESIALELNLQAVERQESQLRRTEKLLGEYRQALASRSDIQSLPGKIQWETTELEWQDISFEELLYRLEGLYSQDRVFTLESFSLKRTRRDLEQVQPVADLQSGASLAETTLGFEVKGYFLCLCQ